MILMLFRCNLVNPFSEFLPCLLAWLKVEFPGIDGHQGPLYVGTGCFHRREVLCGRKFSKESKIELKNDIDMKETNMDELEERLKGLASCTYEENTKWGNEVFT